MSEPIKIPGRVLRAMLLMAANADIRYYLNSVKVEVREDAVYLAATNGHLLGAYRLEREEEVTLRAEFIVPRALLELVQRAKTVRLSYDPDSTMISVNGDGPITSSCTAVEGKFPEWRNVFPEEVTPELADFNPQYITMFEKVAVALKGKSKRRWGGSFATITQNGNRASLVTIPHDDSFIGLLMPWRVDKKLDKSPAWVVPPVKKQAKEKEAA